MSKKSTRGFKVNKTRPEPKAIDEYLNKYVVNKKFYSYLPNRSDFGIVKELIPELKRGEFLVKTLYISADPYMRSFADHMTVPYDQFGFQVGIVVKSKNNDFPVDSRVVSHAGWRDHAVLNGSPDMTFDIKPYIPNIEGLTLSMSIGALGSNGISAYLGLTEILRVRPKNVVCVTSAASGIGSMATQIARLKQCTVIGVCESDEKVKVLLEEFGVHYAINSKTEPDIRSHLRTIAPEGINCFFDNIGGSLAEKIYDCMHQNGRVAVYGSKVDTLRPTEKYIICKNSCVIQSISFEQWPWYKQVAAIDQLRTWIENGDIKVRETVQIGFDTLPDALISCLKREHIGMTLVQL